MNIRRAASRNRILFLYLLLSVPSIIALACNASPSVNNARILQPVQVQAAHIPEATNTAPTPTPSIEVIPVTGLEGMEIDGCPDWDVQKMYEYGEYLYGFYCAGCHGRQGQGVAFSGQFPPLKGSTLADSEDISHSLLYMMNTDIHPNATMLFEKDALAVINYIRITFAENTDIICPGEYIIEINP